MNPATLPSAVANASVVIGEGRNAVHARTASWEDTLDLCASFRQRGIALFLVSGDPDQLCRNLAMSGRAFAHALPSARSARVTTSEFLPFYSC